MRKRLLSLFSEVIQNEPSVLVLEDLDHAMPHVSDAQEQVQENQLDRFLGGGLGGGGWDVGKPYPYYQGILMDGWG